MCRFNIIAVFVAIQIFTEIKIVYGHGRMMNPPARNSMWRLVLRLLNRNYKIDKVVKNTHVETCFADLVSRILSTTMIMSFFVEDTQVKWASYLLSAKYCHTIFNSLSISFQVQWELNQGRCGVCGDPYDMKTPRPHEAGGEYGKGIISKRYFSGQKIDVEIDLTANHYGIFELKLCPNNNPRSEATQECFDKYPLIVSETGQEQYVIPSNTGNCSLICSIKKEMLS